MTEFDDRLLATVDAVFHQVLHGRYGGGIDLQTGVERRTLRAAEDDDRLCIILQAADELSALSLDGNRIIGTVSFSSDAIEVNVATEVFAHHDPNEAADASSLHSGVLFAAMSGGLTGGAEGSGLEVFRSREASASGARQSRQAQRGWLPRPSRNTLSRPLGLCSGGHRRAPTSSLALPVSADLLGRIGTAVSIICASPGAPVVRLMTLLVRTGAGEAA